ncbi:MAG: deoxyribodipyrimidine photo-lyase [Hyphomicrobiaceae bacterium]
MVTTSILLFTLDLRLEDHPALTAAAAEGAVIPLFVWDGSPGGKRPIGGASRWWLAESLAALSRELVERGSRLVLRSGDVADAALAVAEATGARSVHMSRAYEVGGARKTKALEAKLQAKGIALAVHPGRLLLEPEALRTKGGEPFRVFTPFYRAALATGSFDRLLAVPRLQAPKTWPKSDRLEDWTLKPSRPDWARGFGAAWRPGEQGAAKRLEVFVDGPLRDYSELRNRPDIDGVSRMSPYLHFGEISPRRIWHRVSLAAEADPALAGGATAYLRELVWRDFSHQLLTHWPSMQEKNLRRDFDAFPQRTDPAALKAWQRGSTGYPYIDAGLRELWATGWMHNRVRMAVASFLIKHLLLPWQGGERWFWDTLVDADEAQNAQNWQWVAGSGADAAPYFRIFNPISQGRKFDPDGAYVRTWVPELARLPNDLIHAPFEASPLELAAAGVVLGKTYPHPLVEHGAARDRALAAFETIKKSAAP